MNKELIEKLKNVLYSRIEEIEERLGLISSDLAEIRKLIKIELE
ncbi:MAG: hypothetical protein ACTSRI_02775 [Promethearchaeota archaeon]